jgi:hypothetical protein
MKANYDRDDKRPPEPVDRERAMQHALLAIRRLWAGGPPEFDSWGRYKLNTEPLILHDLNGQELFYEFDVLDGNRVAGSVKTSASRTIGTPVPTIELGPRRWDPERATQQAQKQVKTLYPKASILQTELVVYGYPKIGVRVDLDDPKLGRQGLIVDVSDLSVVGRYGGDELEGQTAYSFYHEMVEPQVEERMRRYDLAERELDATLETNEKILAHSLAARELPEIKKAILPKIDLGLIPFISSRTIQYAPRCKPHACFELYAQQTNVYCAVATGQMILDFYRYYYTQDQIAAAMNTGAGGTSNPDQVAGYNSLTHNCLVATFDGTADWAEAKAEIDANRPLKSGIPGHARACAGWMRQNIFIIGQAPRRWLRIYDPWPWNADICSGGNIVWEDWDTVTHTNFIYLRHRTTDCS